ncbi:hypothetical protein ABZV67_41100 [Streptomyces sp. NPDC005065]|uniref:hypothetical protein n=1 Tax=Streptomyces sp. NPDC005065 TaxID=3154461 RepID=UPI0033B8E861
MAGGRRRKYGTVRQSGGRLAPEHRTGGAPVQVLIWRVGCVICGSGKTRIAAQGAECEACYQRRRARSAHRTRLRRGAAGQPTGRLIADRAQAADRMRTLYRKWEALGPDPLPAAITLLERLRAALDSVAVLDTELNRRYLAGTRPRSASAVPREEAAFRRRLLTTLKLGTRTVHDVLDQASDVHESETATALEDTHAFAIVAAAFGHRRTVAAFRRQGLALGAPWKDVRDQMAPLLVGPPSTKDAPADSDVDRAARLDVGLARAAKAADAQRHSELGTG